MTDTASKTTSSGVTLTFVCPTRHVLLANKDTRLIQPEALFNSHDHLAGILYVPLQPRGYKNAQAGCNHNKRHGHKLSRSF